MISESLRHQESKNAGIHSVDSMELPNENDAFMGEFQQEREVVECKPRKNSPIVQNIVQIIRNITVEPLAVLLVMPKWISSLALENLLLEKACSVNLSLNETICEALVLRNRSGYAPQDEIAVQRVVSQMLPYKAASHIIQIFFILMIGSWSDRTGNKRSLFTLPYLGDMGSVLGYLLCVYFFMELSVEYPALIEAALSISLGGVPMLMAGIFSYTAFTSNSKSRTVRVGIASLSFRASMTIGIASSGFMYKYLGFYGVFLIALGMNLIGFIYIFVVIENVNPNRKAVETGKKVSCFRLVWNGVRESLVACLRVCFQSGPNRRRSTMILLQLINILSFGVLTAESSVLYLFSRKQFGWNEVNFSIFKIFKASVEVSGTVFVLAFLSKFWKWTDVQIALLACLSRVISTIVMVFAKSGALFYIGTSADVFNAAIIIAVRSMITKTVDQNEQTLANSLTGIFDSLGAFLMGALYGFVYYHTVAIFPGTFFLVSLFSYISIVVMLLMIRNVVFDTENVKMDTNKH